MEALPGERYEPQPAKPVETPKPDDECAHLGNPAVVIA